MTKLPNAETLASLTVGVARQWVMRTRLAWPNRGIKPSKSPMDSGSRKEYIKIKMNQEWESKLEEESGETAQGLLGCFNLSA